MCFVLGFAVESTKAVVWSCSACYSDEHLCWWWGFVNVPGTLVFWTMCICRGSSVALCPSICRVVRVSRRKVGQTDKPLVDDEVLCNFPQWRICWCAMRGHEAWVAMYDFAHRQCHCWAAAGWAFQTWAFLVLGYCIIIFSMVFSMVSQTGMTIFYLEEFQYGF